jgi:predicted DNA binding protein
MVSIAEFTLPATEFPLGRLFADRPDARLELDRIVPSSDTVMPFFWVKDSQGDMPWVRDFFADLPELRSVDLLVDRNDRGLFHAEWEPEYLGIMRAIGDSEVTVIAASGSRDAWTFEMRATDAEAFSAFQSRCGELELDVTLNRLSHVTELSPVNKYELTPEQHEALVLAYEQGYYDHPRRANQDALAEQLGISRQAFSSRLRRGYQSLIRTTLLSG